MMAAVAGCVIAAAVVAWIARILTDRRRALVRGARAGGRAAAGLSVLRSDLVRIQRREGRTDRVLLHGRLCIAGREHAELNRHDDLLFTGHADGDDQIAADTAVVIDRQVAAAVVGSQTRFAGGVRQLREARQEGAVHGRRHADLKEVGKYQRLRLVSDVDIGTDCEDRIVVAGVGNQEIKLDDHVAGDGDVLRTEDRRTHAALVAAVGFRVQQPFRIVAVGADYAQIFSFAVLQKSGAGNTCADVQLQIGRIVDIVRVKTPLASYIYNSLYSAARRQLTRPKASDGIKKPAASGMALAVS